MGAVVEHIFDYYIVSRDKMQPFPEKKGANL